jgi:hypothetical protein
MHWVVRQEFLIINRLSLAWSMHYYLRELKKEDKEMKDTRYAKKLAYMGAGCGVVLFGVFGLLPGSFLGGVMGLNIAGTLLGVPLASGVLSRLIVAASMVIGVMVSGIMFITASSIAGWLIGTVLDAITAEKKEMATVGHK